MKTDALKPLNIRASTEELARVRRAVRAWCRRSRLPASQRRALLHAVDETVANAIEHGVRSSNGQRISVSPFRSRNALGVRVAYEGDAFNPLEAGPADPREPVRRRRVHGYGLALCRCLVDDIQYRYCEGVNEVDLVVRVAGR